MQKDSVGAKGSRAGSPCAIGQYAPGGPGGGLFLGGWSQQYGGLQATASAFGPLPQARVGTVPAGGSTQEGRSRKDPSQWVWAGLRRGGRPGGEVSVPHPRGSGRHDGASPHPCPGGHGEVDAGQCVSPVGRQWAAPFTVGSPLDAQANGLVGGGPPVFPPRRGAVLCGARGGAGRGHSVQPVGAVRGGQAGGPSKGQRRGGGPSHGRCRGAVPAVLRAAAGGRGAPGDKGGTRG